MYNFFCLHTGTSRQGSRRRLFWSNPGQMLDKGSGWNLQKLVFTVISNVYILVYNMFYIFSFSFIFHFVVLSKSVLSVSFSHPSKSGRRPADHQSIRTMTDEQIFLHSKHNNWITKMNLFFVGHTTSHSTHE